MFKQVHLVVLLVGLMFFTALQPAVAGDLLTYQGRLTDAAGNPVQNSNYSITFRIFNSLVGGVALWTDQFTSVKTTNGLFTVVLGSLAPLDLTSFDDTALYLEIRVGNDLPLLPRVALTTSPKAAVAGKIFGDVQTSRGAMLFKTDEGDSSIAIGSFGNVASFRVFDPQSEPPGKFFELVATTGSGPSMSFFDQAGQVMGVEPSPFNSGFSWVMFDPQPEPPGKMFEITTSYGERMESTALRMYAVVDDVRDHEIVALSASGETAELRMGTGAPSGGTSSLISMKSDGMTSEIQVIGPFGPLAPAPIVMTSDIASAKLGIGTGTPSQALHVVGNICYSGTIGACSDAAFKKDVAPIEGALDVIEHLNGVRYSLKTHEFPNRQFSPDRQIGLIAQEVKEVVPEAVTLQSDGYYTVDYTRLTPVLLEAIKELKKQNEDLVKRLEALEGETR